jgi:type IV secretion system protein TrbL
MTGTDFNVIGTFMNAFLNSVNFGYTAIQPSVNYLMSFMITLVIILTALFTWIWGDWESMIRDLVSKIVLIGFVILLVDHWQTYTDDVGVGLAELGLKAGGTSVLTVTSFLQDPIKIVTAGYTLCESLSKAADTIPTGHFGFANLTERLIYGLAAIGVFLAYCILAIQVIVTYLEFKIINLAALVFVPFAVWKRTSFLSDRSIGYMFSAGIKLFVLALIVSLGITFTVQFSVSSTPSPQNALAVLTGALMLVMLAISIPKLAHALIAGGPQLGAGDAAIGVGATAALVGGAGFYGARALGAAGRAGGSMMDRASGVINNSANATPLGEFAAAATTGGGGGSSAGGASRGGAGAPTGPSGGQPKGTSGADMGQAATGRSVRNTLSAGQNTQSGAAPSSGDADADSGTTETEI